MPTPTFRDPEFPDTTWHLGGALTAWYERAHAAWQRAAARDPDRFLYVPEEVPSEAGQVQQRWLAVLGGRQRYATWRLGNLTQHLTDRVALVEKWLEAKRTRPLLIEGDTGAGKTCLAAATAHEWWQRGARSVAWAPVHELLSPDAYPPRAGPLTLVVLDDLTTAAAAWPSFTGLVERLHGAEARIITTTNLTPAQWHDPAQVDPRVRRRLMDDAVRVPVPNERINDPAPDGPDMSPCPYGCARGFLIAEDHPQGYEHAEAFAAEKRYARQPHADAYADRPELLAELRAKAEREFAELMRTLALPCPHCAPQAR